MGFMSNASINQQAYNSDPVNNFLFGKGSKNYQQSILSENQLKLSEQRNNAIRGKSSTGAYGTAADYYRDLLSPTSQNYDQMIAPEMRNFRENIIPDIGEEFAGMGSGAISSSGFRNSVLRAGEDLSERLGRLRQNAKMQGASGLSTLGQQGLQQETENIHRPATEGFGNTAAYAGGQALVKWMSSGAS